MSPAHSCSCVSALGWCITKFVWVAGGAMLWRDVSSCELSKVSVIQVMVGAIWEFVESNCHILQDIGGIGVVVAIVSDGMYRGNAFSGFIIRSFTIFLVCWICVALITCVSVVTSGVGSIVIFDECHLYWWDQPHHHCLSCCPHIRWVSNTV